MGISRTGATTKNGLSDRALGTRSTTGVVCLAGAEFPRSSRPSLHPVALTRSTCKDRETHDREKSDLLVRAYTRNGEHLVDELLMARQRVDRSAHGERGVFSQHQIVCAFASHCQPRASNHCGSEPRSTSKLSATSSSAVRSCVAAREDSGPAGPRQPSDAVPAWGDPPPTPLPPGTGTADHAAAPGCAGRAAWPGHCATPHRRARESPQGASRRSGPSHKWTLGRLVRVRDGVPSNHREDPLFAWADYRVRDRNGQMTSQHRPEPYQSALNLGHRWRSPPATRHAMATSCAMPVPDRRQAPSRGKRHAPIRSPHPASRSIGTSIRGARHRRTAVDGTPFPRPTGPATRWRDLRGYDLEGKTWAVALLAGLALSETIHDIDGHAFAFAPVAVALEGAACGVATSTKPSGSSRSRPCRRTGIRDRLGELRVGGTQRRRLGGPIRIGAGNRLDVGARDPWYKPNLSVRSPGSQPWASQCS